MSCYNALCRAASHLHNPNYFKVFLFSLSNAKSLTGRQWSYYINILVDSMKSDKYMEAIVRGITYNKSI